MTPTVLRGRHASHLTAAERFWSRVDKTATCWLWRDASSATRYGRFYVNGRSVGAHRFSYEMHRGPIPAGLEVDHLCHVRNCVNPAHLELVTGRENKLRGETLNALNAAKTHCVNGHPFNEANTLTRVTGGRKCRTCHRATAARSRRN